MAAGDTQIGTQATLTFSGFTMELLSLGWSGIAREAIDISHMGTTGGKLFTPGDQYDPGEIVAEVHLDTTEAPPITATATTLTVTFRDSETWSADAFLTGFEFANPMEDKVTATATFKATGAITF